MTSNNTSNNQEDDIQESWKNFQFLDDNPIECTTRALGTSLLTKVQISNPKYQ